MLAKGDLCEIRQVHDKRSSEVRTVKMYRKCDLKQDEIDLIKKEIKLLATLDHPGITKVHATY